jgi:hypothetical protein
MGPVAVTTEPSGALSVNQTGDEVWEYPIAGTVKESTKRAAKRLRTLNLPISYFLFTREGQNAQALNNFEASSEGIFRDQSVNPSLLGRGGIVQTIRIRCDVGESGLKGACLSGLFPLDDIVLCPAQKDYYMAPDPMLGRCCFSRTCPIACRLPNSGDCGCLSLTGDWLRDVRTTVVRSLWE